MSSKTISLSIPAYERLRKARLAPGESFSQVVLRARWEDDTVSAGDLLRRVRETESTLTSDQLDELEHIHVTRRPPEDKWRTD